MSLLELVEACEEAADVVRQGYAGHTEHAVADGLQALANALRARAMKEDSQP